MKSLATEETPSYVSTYGHSMLNYSIFSMIFSIVSAQKGLVPISSS